MEGKHDSNPLGENQVDLLEVTKKLWTKRQLILFVTAGFFILGVLISLLSPKEYTASSTFIPQTQDAAKGGSLGGLASLAGINLSGLGSSSEIPPSLYPKIIKSVQFQRSLLEVPLRTEDRNLPVTYEKYYDQFFEPAPLDLILKYTFGLPGLISKSVTEENGSKVLNAKDSSSVLFRVSPDEIKHFRRLANQIEVKPDDKEGIVELTFTMPEALMAAQMAKAAEELLQKELIAFKIQNAREQLKFTEEQFNKKRNDFLNKQKELALFRDRNQHISSAVAQNQLQSMEAEYNFAFNIYTEMAKQLEQARLQVSQDTPVFTIINPVSIPTEKSAPKRIYIIIGSTFIGGIFALGLIFFLQFFAKAKEQWRAKEIPGAD